MELNDRKLNHIPLLLIFLIGLVFITGCVSQEASTKTPPTTQPPPEPPQTTQPETPTTTPPSTTTPPPETPKTPPETPAPLPTEKSLKALAQERGIRFGAYYNYDRRGDRHDEIFEKEMELMTIYFGWSQIPDAKNNGVDADDLAAYDAQVAWGKARNMELYGQSLVWYGELPDWLKATPNADVEGIMNRRIDTLIGRYKDQIKFWNVVNEAVNDGEGGYDLEEDRPVGTLRIKHKWAEAMGTDYIRKAFVRAHAADPTAVLYYNDYDIESNEAKFEGVKNLLINLKKQGAPVHALGWQMHVKPENFDAATLLARMNEIADLGLDNYITELDVELPEKPTAADFEKQKQTYKGVVETFLKVRRHKTIVTWGLRDGDPDWLTNNHPFIFDENFKKKPAYFGVQEALSAQ